MTSPFKFKLEIAPPWLGALIIILLILGLFVRVINLDHKPYWSDEVHTSVLISGHPFEAQQQLQDGRIITIPDLRQFQQPDPDEPLLANVTNTIANLATEDNRHTPLYYSLTTIWLKAFNYSVTNIRSLSVLFSLLAFPCLYWLCQELFASPLVGWIAMALVAISPAHVLYAQEARPYSLWVLTILLSSATLLRAIRLSTPASWALYGLAMASGIYTHILFVLVALGHGLYVVAIAGFRLKKTVLFYLITSFSALLTFIPWALVIIFIKPAFDAQSEWQLDKQSFISSLAKWVGILSRGFLDVNVGPGDSVQNILPIIPLILLLIGIATYSLYFLCKNTPLRVWWFVVTLLGTTGLALMLPDLLLGQQRGTTRFIFPCILGLQLSVAYLLTMQLTTFNHRKRQLWSGITAAIFLMGIVSSVNIAQSDMWWSKRPSDNRHIVQMSERINQSERPLVVSDALVKRVHTLSYAIKPHVTFQLVRKPNIPEIPSGFSDVFLFEPSESLRVGLENHNQATIKHLVGRLWHLETVPGG